MKVLLALSLAATLAASLAVTTPPEEPRRVDAPIAAPPSDAIVLFDGTSLDGWTTLDGSPARWTLLPDLLAMRVERGAGNIVSRERFVDCQLHLEFRTPLPPTGDGQDRGNSGVYLHGRYEVQVLDSWKAATRPDGQCGAIYGTHPPLVNASREPGAWQTYDIIFKAPRFDARGIRTAPATLTVLHNGVLIHDRAVVDSPTAAAGFSTEEPGPAGLMLQDHGCAVEYRTIWLRRL
jgi:hypothetical protein